MEVLPLSRFLVNLDGPYPPGTEAGGVGLRRYLRQGPLHTVAVQALLVANDGEPPFTQPAMLGGQSVLRGD